jgi:hypothetical protein
VIVIKDEWQRLLFANWVQALVTQRLGYYGTEGTWRFQVDQAGRDVLLDIKPPTFKVAWQSTKQDRQAVDAIIKEAWQRTQALDLGPGAWYRTRFISEVSLNSNLGQLHFMRILSEHQRRRLHGPVRFTGDVLLEFEQKDLSPTPIAIPNFTVDVTLRAPGPGEGPFTARSATDLATLVRAILAYSTAAPLKHQSGGLSFPAKEEDVAPARERLADPSVGEITVDGIVLAQRLTELAPHPELLRRVQGGLYAYEQALLQEGEYVALVMLVSAIEALGVPNVSGWDQRRAVARFINFVQQAAPGPLDEIMAHGNFKEAFGNTTSTTRFLKDLYSRRSRPLHTGFMQHNVQGALGYFARTSVQMRVAFTSELVRACIKSFMEVPFSSLIGHPGIAPGEDD